jgi:diadenosine tetraphosphate (Ap4A) HIT family hydrolase
VSPEAFSDLHGAVMGVERMLRDFVAYEKINYLMLMMVDREVHFHVIPRYVEPREHNGLAFPDAGWPGPPALAQAVQPDAARLAALVAELRGRWAGPPGSAV